MGIVFSFLFVVGCDKNPVQPQNNESTCNCVYESLCIDTIKWGNAQLEDILGEWRFDAFVDTADCEIITAPNIPDMTLKFKNDNHVAGNMIGCGYYDPTTPKNEFNNADSRNQYTFVAGKIRLLNVEMTHVFGQILDPKVWKALMDTCKVFVTNDKLFLLSNGILVFSKIEDTNVEPPISMQGTWREFFYGEEVSLVVFDDETISWNSTQLPYHYVSDDTIQIQDLNYPIVFHSNDCITIKGFSRKDNGAFTEILFFRVK